MRKIFLLVAFAFAAFPMVVAQNGANFKTSGDTLTVQTFEYGWPVLPGWGAPRDGKFLFPPDSVSFRKILMYYTLKCNPAQSPACGEWDYLTYTRLFEKTGMLDSTLLWQTNFVVWGQSPDSFKCRFSPSPKYLVQTYPNVFFSDTASYAGFPVGQGAGYIQVPYTSESNDGKYGFLWKKEELLASGLSAGPIAAIRFNFVVSSPMQFKKLTIRLKSQMQEELDPLVFSSTGWTKVFQSDKTIGETGWHSFPFLSEFTWDGNSNLLVEFSFDACSAPFELKSDNLAFSTGMVSNLKNHCAAFNRHDHIDLPVDKFNTIDSTVTVAFWLFGHPSQPIDASVFEAVDSKNERLLNVHLPWGDGKLYWDAGKDGYDRIEKFVSSNLYKGTWVHWAFVKNLATGRMEIYKNGDLFHSGTNKTKRMHGIRKFRIGTALSYSNSYYDGKLDEFFVSSQALDQAQIREAMKNGIQTNSDIFNHLVAYFKFNESGGFNTMEEVSGINLGMACPEFQKIGVDRFNNFMPLNSRPQVVFERGEFTIQNSTVVSIDTLNQQMMAVFMYDNPVNAGICSDTLHVYPIANYFHFNANGEITDSVALLADTVIYRIDRSYYSLPFEVVNRYELGRYITPYGIGLDLGEGWTWVYDVTDFRPLLADTVHLQAGNWQELLDLKFVMIKGTPPRTVKKVRNVWNGEFALNQFNTLLDAKRVSKTDGSRMQKLRITTTGHQFENPTNCAEFCPMLHHVKINGNTVDQWQILQECADNPLYPQGGTWIFDRAGWCPGMPATTRELELSSFYQDTDTMDLDYGCLQDEYGSYVVETQLIDYDSLHFAYDAAIEMVFSPNNWEMHNRFNPVCGRPQVLIRNTGSEILRDLDFYYGPVGGNSNSWHWQGNLAFDQTDTVFLPAFNWGHWQGENIFKVEISNPNGEQDLYEPNNVYYTRFALAPVYNKRPVLYFKANNCPAENNYQVLNDAGEVVVSRSGFIASAVYSDTLNLPSGCYELVFNDTDNDGLNFWYFPEDGNGLLKLKLEDGTIVERFNADFGKQIRFQFVIDYESNISTVPTGRIKIYPNPAQDVLHIEAPSFGNELELKLFASTGKHIYTHKLQCDGSSGHFSLKLQDLEPGIYFIEIRNNQGPCKRMKFVNL